MSVWAVLLISTLIIAQCMFAAFCLIVLHRLSTERDRQDTQALRHAQDRKKGTT